MIMILNCNVRGQATQPPCTKGTRQYSHSVGHYKKHQMGKHDVITNGVGINPVVKLHFKNII